MRNVKNSIYSLFEQENLSSEDRKSILAMDCLGCKPMTYGEMEVNLHALGSAFNTVCRDEDVITHCGLTTIDSVMCFWAANMVGKKINYVFPQFIAMDPVGYVESTGTKTLIILDIFYPKVAAALSRIQLDRVVISSLADYARPTIDAALPDDLKAMLGKSLFKDIKKNAPADIGYELLSWKEFIGIGAGKMLSEAERSKVAADDVAGIFYTGGSTGRPKGIQLTNTGMRAMHEICLQLKDVFIIEPRDRVFTDTPIAHATAAVHMVIEYMLHGCTLAMQPIFGTQRLLDDIRLLKPNHILASPSQHKPLSKRSDLREGELSFVKRVFSGAEKLYESDYNKLDAAYQKGGVQTHLLDACGMSEYGTMTLLSSDSSRNWMLPVPTTEHRLHDEEGNVIVGDGVGRHHTRTPARMLGYLNNPEGTAEFFDSDGWGDNGDITESKTFPDGRQYLDVLGRDSDMTAFTSREGKRIYGLLVDRLLLNNPDILEAQTVALPVAGEAEAHTLATYIVFEPDADGDQKERLQRIVAECRKEFGGLLLPTKYQILERMPQNGTTHKRDIPLLATGYGDFTDIDEIA